MFAFAYSQSSHYFFISKAAFTALCFACLTPVATSAKDWPQFLGPKGDGTSDEIGWNEDWSAKEPHELWHAEVGIGCASVVVMAGKAYTAGQKLPGKDSVICLDAIKGVLKWEFNYDQGLEPNYYSGGPSSTPVIDGKHLYFLSKSGDLFCLNADTGKVIWHKNYVSDLGGEKQMWGYAASPLLIGEMLICEPGGAGGSVVALSKDKGEVLWKAGADKAGYATPVFFNNEAMTGFACFNQYGLVGYDLVGKELFRQLWKTQYDVNAASPLHKDGQFIISSDYGSGVALIKASQAGAEIIWKNKDLMLQFQNMVLVNDHIFAVSGDNRLRATLKCLEMATGKVKWEEQLRENRGNILVVDGKLLVLSESGELLLVSPDSTQFKPLGKVQVNRKPCWAPPAFSNGLFYSRNNDGALTCFDLR